MKIALATMQLGPAYHHGTERYVESLGESLATRGHDVLFLAGDPRAPKETPLRQFGAPRDGGLLHHPTSGWMTVEGPTGPAEAWLARERPDVVHLANPAHIGVAVGRAALATGIPVVVTAMDFWWTCPRSTLLHFGERPCDGTPGWSECLRCVSSDHPRSVLRRLSTLPGPASHLALAAYGAAALRRGAPRSELALWKRRRAHLSAFLADVDHVVFPSPATREAIAPGLGHARFSLVPYGLAPVWFDAPRARRASGAAAPPPEDLTLGYAGSLQPHKGPHLLLRAVRRLGWTETRVRIAGELDPVSAYGRQLAREALGLRVEFTGRLESTEMRPFLRSLDVLAVTSTWAENLPFTMLEGLAAGAAVVASDVSGIAHWLPDARMRFAPGDEAGLARALEAARESPGAGAPVPTLDAMTDATLAVYAQAQARRGR